jgi:outer membrane protein assembly factor BamB
MKRMLLALLLLILWVSSLWADYDREQEKLDELIQKIHTRIEEIDMTVRASRYETLDELIESKTAHLESLYDDQKQAGDSKKEVLQHHIDYQEALLDLAAANRVTGLSRNTEEGVSQSQRITSLLSGWAENERMQWGQGGLHTFAALAGIYFVHTERMTLEAHTEFAEKYRETGISREDYEILSALYDQKADEGGNDPAPWHNNSFTFGYEDNVYYRLYKIGQEYMKKYPGAVLSKVDLADLEIRGDEHQESVQSGIRTTPGTEYLIHVESDGTTTYFVHSGSMTIATDDPPGNIIIHDGESVTVVSDGTAGLMHTSDPSDPDPFECISTGGMTPVEPSYTYLYTLSHDKALMKTRIDTGEVMWKSTPHGNWVSGLAKDSEGYLYTSGGDYKIRKFDPNNGNIIWTFSKHTYAVGKVVSDKKGFIYSGDSHHNVKKITTDGVEVWNYAAPEVVFAVEVDPSTGNVFAGMRNGMVQMIDSTGHLVWTYQGDHVSSLAVDLNGDVYAGGGRGNGIIKISSSGEEIWKNKDHPGSIQNVTMGSDGCIYTTDHLGTILKTDPDTGVTIARVDIANEKLYGLDVDYSGNIYVGTGDGDLYCYDVISDQVSWIRHPHTSHLRQVLLSMD